MFRQLHTFLLSFQDYRVSKINKIGFGWIFDNFQGGLLSLRILCYKNKENINAEGETCQHGNSKEFSTSFTICVSNKFIHDETISNCYILYTSTESIQNKGIICSGPEYFKEILNKEFTSELQYPLKNIYYVRISVHDQNTFSDCTAPVAIFSYVINETPYPYDIKQYTNGIMEKYGNNYRTVNVSLKLEVSIQCHLNKSSKRCSKYCKSRDNDDFICSENNLKICKTGIECFGKKNGCSPNPCLNNGICIPQANLSTNCLCPPGFKGDKCNKSPDTQLRVSCNQNPCKNEGTCISKSGGTISCVCPQGFKGNRCEKFIGTELWSLVDVLLFGVAVILGSLIVIMIIAICFINIKIYSGFRLTMNVLRIKYFKRNRQEKEEEKNEIVLKPNVCPKSPIHDNKELRTISENYTEMDDLIKNPSGYISMSNRFRNLPTVPQLRNS